MSVYDKVKRKDIDILKSNVNEIIDEINQYLSERLRLEINHWGMNKDANIIDLFEGSDRTQMTQDITKYFQNVWTSSIRKVMSKYLKGGNLSEGAHYDIILDGEEYEIKTTSAYHNKEWSGNKHSHNKVGKHLLIKYEMGTHGIVRVGIYIIDLSCCSKTKWTPGSSKGTSFSVLKIHIDDVECIDSVIGDVIIDQRAKVWATPLLKEIKL